MAVGYCTLYGDMSGGLAVIADVPKTRVYSLCKWLNARGEELNVRRLNVESSDQCSNLQPANLQPSTQKEIIPANILTKPPSAELKPGQVDQDSLPPYDILDDILQRWIEKHQSLEQIVAAGHDAAVVNKVVRMVARAEFKRRQAPPGLKITDRAFGTGWRMPIASRGVAETTQQRGTTPAPPKVPSP
jgi:NAD+ synthetase